jgi:hypothetical protein
METPHAERQERHQRLREEQRLAREQRLLSGADRKCTQLQKSPHWFWRTNGRTYRLSPTKDNKWQLYRVPTLAEDEKGLVLGRYQRRGDATKAIGELAHQPEPSW